jgi:hypothetical protein
VDTDTVLWLWGPEDKSIIFLQNWHFVTSQKTWILVAPENLRSHMVDTPLCLEDPSLKSRGWLFWSKVFYGLFTPYRQESWQYFKVGHHCSTSYPFQLLVYWLSCHSMLYGLTYWQHH